MTFKLSTKNSMNSWTHTQKGKIELNSQSSAEMFSLLQHPMTKKKKFLERHHHHLKSDKDYLQWPGFILRGLGSVVVVKKFSKVKWTKNFFTSNYDIVPINFFVQRLENIDRLRIIPIWKQNLCICYSLQDEIPCDLDCWSYIKIHKLAIEIK